MLLPSIEPDEVAYELQRLLDSPEFRRNRNASAFLKFVVEETLAGRGERLKAFTIATLALQRDDTFDPQNNSIVRVQATRVRQMLETHYSGPGLDDPVQISLPRGSYVPTFARGSLQQPVHGSEPRGSKRHVRFGLMAAVAGALVGAAIGGVAGHRWAESAASSIAGQAASRGQEVPVLLVIAGPMLQRGDDAQSFLAALLGAVRSGLSAFDTLIVSHDEQAGVRPDYVLTATQLGHAPAGETVAFSLVHRNSGAIVWSSEFNSVSLQDPAAAVRSITRSVVANVADVYGALLADWSERTAPGGDLSSSRGCLHAAAQVLRVPATADRAAILACLDRELHANPDHPATMSLLSILLLRGYADGWREIRGAADLQRAMQLARRAYDLAPYRARSQFTLFLARFYDGRYDDAFAMGRQALASNPYSATIRATVGAALVARGRMTEGRALLEEAYLQETALPGSFGAFVALADYLEGDRTRFDRWAHRMSSLSTPIGFMVRLLALDVMRDVESLRATWNKLARDEAGFMDDPRAALARNGFTPDLQDLFLGAIDRARDAGALMGN